MDQGAGKSVPVSYEDGKVLALVRNRDGQIERDHFRRRSAVDRLEYSARFSEWTR